MKTTIIGFLIFTFFSIFTHIQAQNCIEVESILVDACDNFDPAIEGLNEMFRFRVGPNAINISEIQLFDGWPSIEINPQLTFGGFVQNANTQSKTIELNGTITGCGLLREPINGELPAGARVLAITSYQVSATLNSFADLTDTLFVIYHQHSGQQGGHFLNYNLSAPDNQTLTIYITSATNPCTETVTYQRTSLVDVNGINQAQNGATVTFTNSGVATYSNTGCQAPFTPFSANWTNPGVFCETSPPIDLSTLITGTLGGTFTGQGVTGNIFNPSGLNGNIDITYSVVPTNNCLTVPASVTHTVTVSANVTASFSNPINICGSTTGFDLNSLLTGTPGGTWSGQGVSGNILNISGINGPVAITYNVGNANCFDTETQTFNITNLSEPIITGNTIYCGGTNVENLQAIGDAGATINWYADANLTQLISTGTTFLPATGVNTFYFVNQTLNGCVSETASIQMEFAFVQTPQGDTLITYCEGQAIPTLEVVSNGATINWYSDSNLQNLLGNGFSFQPVTNSGTFYVTNVSGNCESLPLVIELVRNTLVTALITSNNGTSLCSGQPIELTSSENSLNEWNTGEQSQNISVNIAGTYTLTRQGICNTASDQIVITGLPVSTQIVTNIDSGYTTLAVSVSSLNVNAESCNWYKDSVGIDFTAPGIINFPDSGSYELKLICTNSSGCADTSYKTIKVKSDKLLLVVPNVFSPNGDNFNDLFKVKYNAVKTFNAQVFNRWGKPIFSWNDVENGWDGTFNGEKVGEGTYFYVINGSDIKDKEFVEKGTVLLIGN
jgi:gliding motility-associated-like protein